MKLATIFILSICTVFLIYSESNSHAVMFSDCINGSGKGKTEQRALPSFSSIETEGAFRINIVCGKKQSFTISGDDNILPHIETSVSSGTLLITSEKAICPKREIVVDLSLDNLKALNISGAGTAEVSAINSSKFMLRIDGSGDADLSGQTKEFRASISGSGELHAKDLRAKKVEITIEGAGEADVYASESLDIFISGAADVNYWGNPATVNQEILGVGNVAPK